MTSAQLAQSVHKLGADVRRLVVSTFHEPGDDEWREFDATERQLADLEGGK